MHAIKIRNQQYCASHAAILHEFNEHRRTTRKFLFYDGLFDILLPRCHVYGHVMDAMERKNIMCLRNVCVVEFSARRVCGNTLIKEEGEHNFMTLQCAVQNDALSSSSFGLSLFWTERFGLHQQKQSFSQNDEAHTRLDANNKPMFIHTCWLDGGWNEAGCSKVQSKSLASFDPLCRWCKVAVYNIPSRAIQESANHFVTLPRCARYANDNELGNRWKVTKSIVMTF